MRRQRLALFTGALLLAFVLPLATSCALLEGALSPQTKEATSTIQPPPAGIASPGTFAPAPTAASSAPVSGNRPAVQSTGDLSGAVRSVSERVRPTVVQITTQEEVQLDRFSEPFTVPSGVGSGVIYDDEGLILTNNHVVEGAQDLLVSLSDGRSFPGQVIGRDPQTDLAVVRIQGDNLPVAALGDSRQLQVGDWVVAIGNALGLPGGPTVTAGVVSALGRTIQQPGDQSGPGPYLFDLVQTDTAINPGNSGGPLMNLAGEVIGINTMVAATSQSGLTAQGIGFAIGISTAKPIADEIVATGRVAHAYIGIEYVPLNPAIAAQVRTEQRSGALIQRVVPNSPAARGGLRQNDIIVEADGKAIEGESALAETLKSKKPGDQLALTVLRGNQRTNLTVTLGERP